MECVVNNALFTFVTAITGEAPVIDFETSQDVPVFFFVLFRFVF